MLKYEDIKDLCFHLQMAVGVVTELPRGVLNKFMYADDIVLIRKIIV